jgi:O-antigen/teichoic acid export membrane protein
MIEHLKRFGRRLVVMIGGEALQSAFHFGLNIALVQMLTAHDYGAFATVMVLGGVGLTYIRAFAGMPVSLWTGRSRSHRAAGAYGVTFGSGAAVLSLVLGAATGAIMLLWIGAYGLVVGIFVGLWCMRSYLRNAMFALGLQGPAIVGDTVYTLAGAALSAVFLSMNGGDKLQAAFVILGVANACGIATILALARRPVRFSLGRNVWRRYRKLLRQLGWTGLSVTTANLQGQGLPLLLAATSGPAAFAPIAAGLVLFAPLRVISLAFANLMQPVIAADVSRRETDRLWSQSWSWSLVMGAGCVVYGAAMIVLLPHIKSQVFVGAPIYVIGFCCWAIYAATLLYVIPRLILEAANAFRAIAVITAVAAVVGMVMIALILTIAQPAWSLIGAFVSEIIVLVACWAAVRNIFASPPARPGEPAPRASKGLSELRAIAELSESPSHAGCP